MLLEERGTECRPELRHGCSGLLRRELLAADLQHKVGGLIRQRARHAAGRLCMHWLHDSQGVAQLLPPLQPQPCRTRQRRLTTYSAALLPP